MKTSLIKGKCKHVKTKIKTDVELLQTELFKLPLNRVFIQEISAGIENKLNHAILLECFDNETLIQLRLLVNNLNDLSSWIKKNNEVKDLSWFNISIKYLLLKLKISETQ